MNTATFRTFEDAGILVPPGKSGNIKVRCPQCSDGHGKHDKPLSVHVGKGIWRCHRCPFRGTLNGKYEGFPYEYRDSRGRPHIKWRRERGARKCDWGKEGTAGAALELYGALLPGKPVWCAEGEPDVDALIAEGLRAVTNPNGSGEEWDVRKLKAASEVRVLWDRDEAGEKRRDWLCGALRDEGIPYLSLIHI